MRWRGAYAKAKETYGPGSLATYALAEPSEAEAVLKRVEEAFAVLSDTERRKSYDTAQGFAAAPETAPASAAESPAKEPPPASQPPKEDPRKEEPPKAEPPKPEVPPEVPKVEPPSKEPPREDPPKVEAHADVQASQPTQPPGVNETPAPRVDSKPEPKPEVTEPNLVIPTPPPPSSSSPTDPSGFAPAPSAVSGGASSSPTLPPSAPAAEAVHEPKATPVASTLSLPPPQNISGVDKPVRKTEAELAPDGPVTGEALKRVREARGLSLKDLEARTKIGHWHLDSIEKERYSGLPAHVYLRGFLMSLARELKLDPVRVSKSYLEQMKAKQAEKAEKP